MKASDVSSDPFESPPPPHKIFRAWIWLLPLLLLYYYSIYIHTYIQEIIYLIEHIHFFPRNVATVLTGGEFSMSLDLFRIFRGRFIWNLFFSFDPIRQRKRERYRVLKLTKQQEEKEEEDDNEKKKKQNKERKSVKPHHDVCGSSLACTSRSGLQSTSIPWSLLYSTFNIFVTLRFWFQK